MIAVEGAARSGKETERLARAVTVDERIFLRVGECFAELADDVTFEVKGVVVQKLVRDLDCHVQLVRIENDLRESRIAELQRSALFDPGRRRRGVRNIDFVFAARGDFRSKTANHVLLFQHLDDALVVFFGNEVAARCVHSFLKNIADTMEIGTQRIQHRPLIFIARPARLGILGGYHRLCGKGRGYGFLHLLFHLFPALHTLDFGGHCLEARLHLCVCGIVLFGQNAIRVLMRFQEPVHRVQEFLALCNHFIDSHCCFSSSDDFL